MNERPPPVFLLTGPPAAGKTETAEALTLRFSRAVHIPVDDMLGWVVSGIAGPVPTWTGETSRQFARADRAAGKMARGEAYAGVAVGLKRGARRV